MLYEVITQIASLEGDMTLAGIERHAAAGRHHRHRHHILLTSGELGRGDTDHLVALASYNFV